MTITEISAAPRIEATPILRSALRPTSPPATTTATPKLPPRAGSKTPSAATDHAIPDGTPPPGADFPPTRLAAAPSDPPSAGTPGPDHELTDTQLVRVGAGPILYDPALGLLAMQLDAIEGLRIASQNRHRMATRDVADSDGRIRGLGLTEDNPAVKRSAVMLDALEEIEHQVVLGLNRLMRAHPLGPWQKATRGVGEKQLARLLACIGDPFWNTAKDEPRTVSQLWAYCGLHVLPAPSQVHNRDHTNPAVGGDVPAGGDLGQSRTDDQEMSAGVAARRAKGQRANWSTAAKTKAYLIAESCLKAGSYRNVYDDHKARAATAIHVADCAPCKAKAGSPLAPGHQHARAMRAMSKQILKDLWIEARRIHGGATS